MRESSTPAPEGSAASVKVQALAQAFLQYVRARVDLLSHELQAEQSRVLGKLARAGIFAAGAVLTLQLVVAFVLIAFWDTPWRLHAAGALVLVAAAITWKAWRGLSDGEREEPAFASSIAEFDKDREILERLSKLGDKAPASAGDAANPHAARQAAVITTSLQEPT